MSASNPEPQPASAPSTGAPVLHCSFCGRDSASVGKLIAGPGASICDRCVAVSSRIIDRENAAGAASQKGRSHKPASSAAFGAWDQLPDEMLLRAASRTDQTLQDLRDVLKAQVSVLRGRGVAWQKIGDALGATRQSVWERFGK